MMYSTRIEQWRAIHDLLYENDSTLLDTFPMSDARRNAMCKHFKKSFVEMEDFRFYWKGWEDDYSRPR
jgi:hypothetical protein